MSRIKDCPNKHTAEEKIPKINEYRETSVLNNSPKIGHKDWKNGFFSEEQSKTDGNSKNRYHFSTQH